MMTSQEFTMAVFSRVVIGYFFAIDEAVINSALSVVYGVTSLRALDGAIKDITPLKG